MPIFCCRSHARQVGPLSICQRSDSNQTILSVMIVSWNTRELLERCLQSILADCESQIAAAGQPPQPTIEVFVVDNASSDGSSQMVRSASPGRI